MPPRPKLLCRRGSAGQEPLPRRCRRQAEQLRRRRARQALAADALAAERVGRKEAHAAAERLRLRIADGKKQHLELTTVLDERLAATEMARCCRSFEPLLLIAQLESTKNAAVQLSAWRRRGGWRWSSWRR